MRMECVTVAKFLYMCVWQVMQLHVGNLHNFFYVCLRLYMCKHMHVDTQSFICFVLMHPHGEHSSVSDLPLFFSFHPSVYILLFSPLPLLSPSSGQPFMSKNILVHVFWGKNSLFFHLLPFSVTAIWITTSFNNFQQDDLWDETGLMTSNAI